MANRLRIWAEKLGLLDDNQAGFRVGRSTADVTQVMNRIHEDVSDLYKRAGQQGENIEEDDRPMATLLDLRKAYPRVNKPALWRLLERYGMRQKALETLKNIHETTTYRVKSREGDSEPWTPERGLREGDPSSPPLFNIFHQAVMRDGQKRREDLAERGGKVCGLTFKWVPATTYHRTNSGRNIIQKQKQ